MSDQLTLRLFSRRGPNRRPLSLFRSTETGDRGSEGLLLMSVEEVEDVAAVVVDVVVEMESGEGDVESVDEAPLGS